MLSPSRERLNSQPTLLFPASSGRGKAFRERWYKVGGRRSFSHVGSPSQFDKRRVDVAVHEDPGTQVIGLLALGIAWTVAAAAATTKQQRFECDGSGVGSYRLRRLSEEKTPDTMQ